MPENDQLVWAGHGMGSGGHILLAYSPVDLLEAIRPKRQRYNGIGV